MSGNRPSRLDRVFELRTILAILFGVYGVFCVIWGIGFTTSDEIRRAGGFNMNLVMGIVMLVAAVAFSLWVVARPVEQERPSEETEQESTQSR
jgi:drug/metabolite transporter (DMT)-like permease